MDSPDGDENFPGHVKAKVTYNLTDDNAIVIAYEATTDAPTVVNMTNHSYFNLSGDPSRTILDHLLTVDADSYTPVDSTYMTTGEIAPVEGTPMDFRTETAVGARLHENNEHLKNANGYDHNWVLATAGDAERTAARLVSPRQASASPCAPPSRDCKSTRATSSTARSKARVVSSTTPGRPSASKRNITPTAPTNRNGPRPCCAPARLTRASASTDSPSLNNLFFYKP